MKIGLINLGCPKNQVDSEIMLGMLKDAGFELTFNEEEAEIVVVNTCGFIDAAKEESINTMLHLAKLKKVGKCRLLVAAGCLPQRYKDELLKEMPEIDAVVGTGSFHEVVTICKEFMKRKVTPQWSVGGAIAPERLTESSWAPVKARKRRAVLALSEAKKASPLEAGRLPRLRDLDRSTAKARSEGATAPPVREALQQIYITDPANFSYERPLPRIRISPAHTAFVKIAEGCDHTCTFCIIPVLRGKQRSRTIDSIAGEVERLSMEGVVEINLVAQDSTAYGRDLREPNALARLLQRLVTIRDIQWIRLLYTYPGSFIKDLIDVMAGEEKICNYIDMPVQHINDDILRGMHRGHTRKSIYRTIETLRKKIPDVILRTSLIVGFPGETEKQFNELIKFVEEVAFDRLGVFTYSNEEGTEAYSLPDQTKEKEMEKRRDILMKTQQKISLRKNQRLIGSKQIVLIDGPSQDAPYLLEGRTYGHAPEVDGVVYIADMAGSIPTLGEFVSVEITEAHPYDLIGKLM